ncbi:MAG: hypothetical protein J0L99_09580 [Chitinophagales bacterium]|nr:hypothetical protein [Chitinophagales bacterium]
MKNFIFKTLFAFSAFALTLTACKKEDEGLSGTQSVIIEMDNRAGDDELVFGKNYKTANGDTVNFSLFNYYVSNFVLVKSDGSEYTVPKDECYFLVKHEDAASREIELKGIPAGDYKAVRFIIGVDSLKSIAPAGERTGVLDPTGAGAGMYWSWNAGYIFVKVEGTSPQAPINAGAGERIFQYHTGLFGGKDSPTLNNLKTVNLSTGSELIEVRSNHEASTVHTYVNILEMFTSPTNINVATNPLSHAGAFSKTVANNYADMFTLDHVHNHN